MPNSPEVYISFFEQTPNDDSAPHRQPPNTVYTHTHLCAGLGPVGRLVKDETVVKFFSCRSAVDRDGSLSLSFSFAAAAATVAAAPRT